MNLKNKYNLNFEEALRRLESIITQTPLTFNKNLSERYKSNIYLKREDLQICRSFKIRGAYNMISSLSDKQQQKGVVCSSAGNHAQGFAHSCNMLKIKGVVFMPAITPMQKIKQTKMFGDKYIEVILTGDTYDECAIAAKKHAKHNKMTFIPPFADEKIIEGQGTLVLEVLSQMNELTGSDAAQIDYFLVPIGGGGLCSGVGVALKGDSRGNNVKIIGLEPSGAAAMNASLQAKKPVILDQIDTFVDGAAVKQVSAITYDICSQVTDDLILVPEGKICTTILQLYNEEAIVVEPAGAMSVAALDLMKDEIKGKNVVCLICGGNNDIDRMQEIKERSLRYEGLKHYFLVRFPQRAGALKEFVSEVLGPDDDITRFEYMQKHNKETGPALVGILLKDKKDYGKLLNRMKKFGVNYTKLDKNDNLYGYIV